MAAQFELPNPAQEQISPLLSTNELEINGESPLVTSKKPSSSKRRATSLGETQLPFKKRQFLGSLDELITIIVGSPSSKTKTFFAHKKVLFSAGPAFKTLCESDVIRLPYDDVGTVEVMLHWIYHDEIAIPRRLLAQAEDEDKHNALLRILLRLFRLAERHHQPDLCNSVADAIAFWIIAVKDSPSSKRTLDAKTIFTACMARTAHGPMRRLVLAIVWSICDKDGLELLKAKLDKEFWSAFSMMSFHNSHPGVHIEWMRKGFCARCHVHLGVPEGEDVCHVRKPFYIHGETD